MKRLLLMGISLVSVVAVADPTNEVRCREIGFSKAIEAKDIEAFKSFLDADARFIGRTVRRGPDDISAGWSVFAQEAGPAIRWRPIYVEVLKDGKLALSRGVYETVSTAEDGSAQRSYGSFNSTWRLNDDGVWRVVFDAGDPWHRQPSDEELAFLEQDDDCGA